MAEGEAYPDRIIGDYTGTTFEDFLVLPGLPSVDYLTPEAVNLESDICGIKMGAPFFTAAMRSITDKELMLAAGKAKMMGVSPRGPTPEKEAEIVQYTKDREVKRGEIESETDPERLFHDQTLGDALKITKESGHSNIPVVDKGKAEFLGMFTYMHSEHDLMPPNTPITEVMSPYKNASGSPVMDVCDETMSDEKIKSVLNGKKLRFVPVLDSVGRLSRLVFLQKHEAYKAGAAIDTHKGWERRASMLVEAGADMIFIDTSNAYTQFTRDVVVRYKEMFPEGPPICAGNIVTAEAFEYLAEAGADVIKVGMGPGSICSTNEVLCVGAPPFWALIEMCWKRDEYAKSGRYVPVLIDGGIKGTGDINVSFPFADGLMGGNIFGCFDESAGVKAEHKGNKYVRIFGEASKEAFETTGDMNRYSSPLSPDSVTTFQGVSGWIPYKGRFKPGLESYKRTLREAMCHAGCKDLAEYRQKARLIRLSERAKEIAKPHSVIVIGE